jgi:hypothetical protein
VHASRGNAKVIAAEGEYQMAQRLADASAIVAKEPISRQLRFLQTLVEIASQNNSTNHLPGADRHPGAVPVGDGGPHGADGTRLADLQCDGIHVRLDPRASLRLPHRHTEVTERRLHTKVIATLVRTVGAQVRSEPIIEACDRRDGSLTAPARDQEEGRRTSPTMNATEPANRNGGSLASGARWSKPARVSAIRHPDVMEYLGEAEVVEVNRRVEHCGVPGLQMACDDACLDGRCTGEQGGRTTPLPH